MNNFIKYELIQTISKNLDVNLRSRMSQYGNEFFKDSQINKLEFFRNVVHENLTNEEIDFLNSRCNLEFLRDERTPLEYGVEIAFGWIMEDIIFWAIQDQGIAIRRDGNDQHREYLEVANISSTADYIIDFPWGQKHLELVVSWGDHWIKKDRVDFRATKYNSMVNKGTICLGVEAPTDKAFCIDIKHETEFEQTQNPSWGNKTCFTLRNLHKHLKPIKETIKQINLI